jgi:GDP-L-fucose synthase
MKILITGANGYIGKSLYNALKDKYEVIALTRADFDLIDVNAMEEFFKNKYFDVVLHCAIVGGHRLKEDSEEVKDINTKIYFNLYKFRHTNYDKFINFGSGVELNHFTYTPSTFISTPYSLSKSIIRTSVISTPNFFNIIIFGLFDENELDTRFIKSNIKRYINKESLQVYENKAMTFFYMKDFITLIKHYITTNKYQLHIEDYCSYDKNYTLLEIANIINELDDYKVDIILGNNGNDYKSEYVSKYSLSYIGLEQGIKEIYNKLK